MNVYVNLLQGDGLTKTVKVHLTMDNIFRPNRREESSSITTTTEEKKEGEEEEDQKSSSKQQQQQQEQQKKDKSFDIKSRQVGQELAGIDILSDFCKFCTYLAFKLVDDDNKNDSDVERDGELRTAAVETANTMSVMLPGGCGGPISPGEVPAVQLSTAFGSTSAQGKMTPTGSSLYAPHVLPPELQDSQYWRGLLLNHSSQESGTLFHSEVYLLPWRRVLNPVADLMALITGWMPQLDPAKAAKNNTNAAGRDSTNSFLGASPQQLSAASPEMLAKLASSIDGKAVLGLMGQQAEDGAAAITQRGSAVLASSSSNSMGIDVTASYSTRAQIDEANKVLMGVMALDLDMVSAAAAAAGQQQQQAPGNRAAPSGGGTVIGRGSGGGGKDATKLGSGGKQELLGKAAPVVPVGVKLPQFLGHKTSFTDDAVDVGPTALSSVTISKSLLCTVCKKIPYPEEVAYISCCGAFGCRNCLVINNAAGGGSEEESPAPQQRNSTGNGAAGTTSTGGSPLQQQLVSISVGNTAAMGSSSNPSSPTNALSSGGGGNGISKGPAYHCTVCTEALNSANDPARLRAAQAQAIKISNAVKAFLTAHSKDKDPATLIMMPGSGSSSAAMLSNLGVSGSSFSTTSGGAAGRGTTIAPPPGFNRPPLPSQVSTSHHHHHNHHHHHAGGAAATAGGGGGLLSSPRSPAVQAVMSHPPQQQQSPGFQSPVSVMPTSGGGAGGGSGVLGGSPMLPSPLAGAAGGAGGGGAGGASGGGGFNAMGSPMMMGTAPLIPQPQGQQQDPGLLRPEAEGAPSTNRRRLE